ncbi:MFS transporter [Candidatus Bathyarchaeota archaeon]|nr:MFS transporter [Candidatus Bathyarchaeota archaeon]
MSDDKMVSAAAPPSYDDVPGHSDPVERPRGWMYRGFGLGGKEFWYALPSSQLLMVSLVCFLCPGMFNALSGMGGAGLADPSAAAKANTALYATFAIVAFFAGTITNVLGVRITLALGGMGYTVYVAAFFCFAHTENMGFVMFSGVFLGICAGMLWTAQGAIMMSYPEEKNKGRYISWFWIIFNMGAVIGSLVRPHACSKLPPPR